ncbi:hypothetical protein [Xanthobacter aminoxidans]|uniref:Uncharacterized protein n=1 Tax=Xanthobacter aminoxidans TaxID=186280 RepID=A0ABW6ZD28_9HYPH
MIAPPEFADHAELASRYARNSAVWLLGLCLHGNERAPKLCDRELGEHALACVRGGAVQLLPASTLDDEPFVERFRDYVGLLSLREFNRLCAAWRTQGGQA